MSIAPEKLGRFGQDKLGILTLDLATQCGWALSGPPVVHLGDRPFLRNFYGDELAWGTLDLDRGMRMAQLKALEDFLDQVLPYVDHVLREATYEAPHRRAAARVLTPMADMVDFKAREYSVESWFIAAATWRKHFLGFGTGKRDDLKEAAKKQCALFGWNVTDDNQADALGLMDYARACFNAGSKIALMAQQD